MRTTTALACLGVMAVAAACGTSGPAPGGGSTSTVTATTPKIQLSSATLPAGFVADAMAEVGGQVWAVGRADTRCGLVRVDPATLATAQFPLPYCSAYLAAGAGHLYLAVDQADPGSDSDAFRLEVFDPATNRAVLMTPTIATARGSDRSHLSFAYGSGLVWLYNWENSQLVGVSPTAGSTVASVSGVRSGGGHAVITATTGAVWVAEGPGGRSLYRAGSGSTTATVVFTEPSPGSLLWSVAAGDRVWAASATFGAGDSMTTRLVAFDGSGRQVAETGPVAVGEADAVYAAGSVWSVGTAGRCQDPLKLWRTDAVSGATREVTNLATPVDACLTVGPDHLAVAGKYVFVLETTGSAAPAAVLYRVTAG